MAPSRWSLLIGALLRGEDLDASDTRWAMDELLAGEATPAQVAGFAVALRAKGETADEVAGLVEAMLGAASVLPTPAGLAVVDTCGTGGDGAGTVNLSTMAAFVASGAGLAVAKHGNRAASSICGSADLLEALGVVIDLPPAGVAACLASGDPVFCFAPVFHPALRHAAVARREIGVPTFFNILGPLTNPARPAAQVVGVADARLAPVVAGVLARRGVSALVVHGEDGLDELSTTVPSRVWEVRAGSVSEQRLDPADLGIAPAAPGALRGGDAAHNAEIARAFLAGATGPVRDAALLNAAAALVAADVEGAPHPASARGAEGRSLTERMARALQRAGEAVDDGRAAAALQRWAEASQRQRAAG